MSFRVYYLDDQLFKEMFIFVQLGDTNRGSYFKLRLGHKLLGKQKIIKLFQGVSSYDYIKSIDSGNLITANNLSVLEFKYNIIRVIEVK